MLPGAWMGATAPSKAADAQEPVTSQKRSALNTEYKLKFRPFSDYTYVDGHFTGARDATDGVESADRAAADAASPPTPWYEEVVELRKKASSYKVRGWGKEMAQPHLAHLYDREEDPGQLAERKIISALYLETIKTGFVREERGRSPVSTGGAAVRQQSHPPPSSRKSPGAPKMALKLHAAEGSKRPHSAQPSSDRHAGDVVDRAKGRSPATPRTPTSRTDTAASAAVKPRKRPTERPPSVDKAEKSATRPASDKATARPTTEKSAARPTTEKATTRHATDKVATRPPVDKKIEKPIRPPAEKAEKKAEKTDKKAEKTPRPGTAKSDRAARAAPGAAAPAAPSAPEPPSGTPDSTSGKGIRGGTPRSRSAHRLAAKAKSPTKAERPLSAAMTASAPAAGSTEQAVEPAADAAEEEAKPAAELAGPAAARQDEQEPSQTEPAPPAVLEPVKSAVDEPAGDAAANRAIEEVVRSVPEPTRVKSPEGMAPIKSPEPVNWTVPLDTGKTFTVTQNVMGGHGSPMSSRADSLRSPTEDSTRSPLARGVTDVSHLRNGEPAAPPAGSPLANDLPATNGRDGDNGLHYQPATGSDTSRDTMQGSFHVDAIDYGAQSDVIKSLQDPMTASMTGEDLRRSLLNEDPMSASMTGDDLKRSLYDQMATSMTGDDPMRPIQDPMATSMTGEDLMRPIQDPMATSMTGDDLKRPLGDPMTASMTGDDLRRTLHDPMASSMTGDELQRSFHADGDAAMSGSFHADQPAAGDAAMTGSFHAAPPPVPARSAPAQRVLDDPLMAAATFSRPAEPPSFSERPVASSLFSSGSAGPPRFSHELFGSGRPAEPKPESAEKPLYRVI